MAAGFEVLGVDHVTVTAPDELMDETLTWYRELLGLEELDKPQGAHPSGAWFRAGTGEIHISGDPHNPPKSAHYAIVVSNFDAIVERLRASGHHIEQAATIPGRQRCYTRDPAGNRIEISYLESGP
jgi:catechol 2,3-dioxygenase-like lactoylglutathione lyase family enzyme